jgi:hypothetical protein
VKPIFFFARSTEIAMLRFATGAVASRLQAEAKQFSRTHRTVTTKETMTMQQKKTSTKQHTVWAAVSLLGLCGLAAPAHAGRPFVTEDAGVLEKAECEWESVAARARTRGEPRETGWSTQVGCGVGLNTQLALSFARSKFESERTNAWALGGKTGLIDGGEEGTSLTLAYGAVSAKGPGDGSYRWNTAAVNLVVTQPLPADWTLHGNVGWTRDRPSKLNTTTWAVAAEWAASEQWAVGAEVYGDDRDKPWFGVGARWTLSEAWSLNASYAVNRETPRASAASVGFKFVF